MRCCCCGCCCFDIPLFLPRSALGGVFFFHPGAKRRKKRTPRQTEQNEQSDGGRPEWQARQVPNTHDRLARSRRSSERPEKARSSGRPPERREVEPGRAFYAPPCFCFAGQGLGNRGCAEPAHPLANLHWATRHSGPNLRLLVVAERRHGFVSRPTTEVPMVTQAETETFVTPEEAAAFLHYSPITVKRMA